MLTNLEKKLDKISPIYTCIYRWIIEHDDTYNERIKQEKELFMQNTCNAEQLESKYVESFERANCLLNKIREYKNIVSGSNIVSCDLVDLRVFTALLKTLYLDVQKELFFYNTLFNKVFFNEKLEIIFDEINQENDIDLLDLLKYIDQSTDYSYLENKKEVKLQIVANNISSHYLVKNFIKLLSLQKYWERVFNRFFDENFTPILIDLRSEIHKCCKKNNIVIPEESMYCVWNLLDFLLKTYKVEVK